MVRTFKIFTMLRFEAWCIDYGIYVAAWYILFQTFSFPEDRYYPSAIIDS